MSGAPILSGMRKFPKTPINNGMMTKNTMTVACMVTSMLYPPGINAPVVVSTMFAGNRCPKIGNGLPGKPSCQRMPIAKMPEIAPKIMLVKRYCLPIILWSCDHTYVRKNPW